VKVLQPGCGKPVWNRGVLRSPCHLCRTGGEDVHIRPQHSPRFSARERRSRSGPSDVLRMIRSPYSYNLSFLKKKVVMVAPRSSSA